MLLIRPKNAKKIKHYRRSSKKQNNNKKPIIMYDHETIQRNALARENALLTHYKGKLQCQDGIFDTAAAEVSVKQRISIWRAAFERIYDKMNHKINELMDQVKESDKKAQVLNLRFYDNVSKMNRKFNDELVVMKRESEKRNKGLLKGSQAQKFMDDLGALNRENNKRNTGFHIKINSNMIHATKFKKMCEENQKRNEFIQSRKKFTVTDKMSKMNENRTAPFMCKRPYSKFDAVISLNDKRTAGFTTKKPMTKLEEITMWNGQRNAVFSLRA